jgi:type II secretory ATPase GspE/PulE/Tfp pilus assembly ATPase PilB-like protein
MIPPDALPTANFRRGTGCNECLETGFQGRTAVTELLLVDEIFRDAVLQKLPTRALQQVAVQQGMATMWQNGLNRALSGQTTLEEIIRVVAAEQM